MNPNEAERLITCTDLTSLSTSDTDSTIEKLCHDAITPYGAVAAICVLPKFVKLASKLLSHTNVHIATVSNFPQGSDNLILTVAEIKQAQLDGAHEIDVVMPYQAYLAGEKELVINFLNACRSACGNACLKIILETGALKENHLIAEASELAIQAGADFIKTSTGKYEIGATLEAAEIMLKTIQASQRLAGLKVAGGIRTLAQGEAYMKLAEKIMGNHWINSKTFRIGSSSLIQNILHGEMSSISASY